MIYDRRRLRRIFYDLRTEASGPGRDALPATVRSLSVSTGIYISCLAVLILSLGTLALSPFLGDSVRIIGADPVTAALFVIGTVATMGTLTFDNAAVGLHRGSAQLWRRP